MTHLITALLAVVLMISIGGHLEQLPWQFAYYSNPRPHFILAAIAALAWYLLQKKPRLAVFAMITIAINALSVAPFLWPVANKNITTNAQSISILHLNTNKSKAALGSLPAADILFLQELQPELAEKLPALFPNYKLLLSHPLENTQGSAILLSTSTEIPQITASIINLPDYSTRPMIVAQLTLAEKKVAIISTHTTRPHHQRVDTFQKIELDALAKWSLQTQANESEVIMIGDFNTTPWSSRFKSLLTTGALNNSQLGYGLQNTWPSALPNFLRIPIDHALYSDHLHVIDRQVIDINHSDHTALLVTFGL